MNVGDLMQHDLVTVSPNDSMYQVCRVLESGHVGSALVVDEGNAVGILTEHDVVRAVSAGEDLKSVRAADFMSSALTTIGVDDSMAVAAELMTRRAIRHLPVVDQGSLVGVLSIRDVVRWTLDELPDDKRHELPDLVDLV